MLFFLERVKRDPKECEKIVRVALKIFAYIYIYAEYLYSVQLL